MKIKGSEDRDDVKLLAENKDALLAAGMGFYKSISGDRGVMFNLLKIHPQDLAAADKQGKLTLLAPDFDALNHEAGKMGKNHPILSAKRPAAQLAAPVSTQAPPQAASGMLPQAQDVQQAPASVARKLAAQRILNLMPGAPSSGPAPGAGRLTNQILKPVI